MKFLSAVKQNKHGLLMLYFPLHFLWYEILRIANANNPNVWLIASPLDEHIPFCEWFIFPYIIWYLYIAFMLIYSFNKSKREFLRTDLMLTASMFLPMLFCTLVPNGIPISFRPDIAALGRENIALKLVELIYLADSPPLNVLPSVHSSVSCTLFFSAMRSESLKGKHFSKVLAGALSLSIVLSTVLIKQHSVIDSLVGIAVASLVLIADIIIEKIIEKKPR
ncbi:MAG: hypothetical protein IJO64_01670 [Clostridia bacterium]|nr:hypothetical protein [Clostridia bacterium]